jgi:hypothetical protein
MSTDLLENPAAVSGDREDWIKAIATLIRRTEEGKIKWKSNAPPEALGSSVEVVFTAEYGRAKLRTYTAKDRGVIVELGLPEAQGWYEVPIPTSYAASELLDSVMYQVYGVSDFLTKIINGG